MRHIYLLFWLLAIHLTVAGQEYSPLNLQLQERFLLNPALTGIDPDVHISTGYQNQWIGINNSPKTAYVSISGNKCIISKWKAGLGSYLINDRFGPFKRNTFGFSASVNWKFAEHSSIGIGSRLNVSDIGLNYDLLKLPVPSSLLNETLIQILDERYTKPVYNFRWGGQVQHSSDKDIHFNAGASFANLKLQVLHLKAGFGKKDKTKLNFSELLQWTTIIHPYFSQSHELSFKGIFLDNAAWIAAGGRINTPDYDKNISFFLLKAGVQMTELLNIAYAINVPIANMTGVNVTSHELRLQFILRKKTSTCLFPSDNESDSLLSGNEKPNRNFKGLADTVRILSDSVKMLSGKLDKVSSEIKALSFLNRSDSIENELLKRLGSASHPKPLSNSVSLPKEIVTIFFDFNDAGLSIYAKHQLNQVFMTLKKDPRLKVILAGYTDHLGSDEYNKALSEKRINAVKNYLLINGIQDSQLIPGPAKGKSDPISENPALNRRVEIVFFR